MVACGMAENIVLTNKYKIMSREIKFRIFDKGDNKMKYADIEHFDDMFGFRFEHKSFEADGEPDMIELMQSTGLKDSRGIEIYEGDIIKKTYGASIPVFTVAWHDARAMFIQHDGYNEALFHLAPANMKVIGNIYENPDLLKV